MSVMEILMAEMQVAMIAFEKILKMLLLVPAFLYLLLFITHRVHILTVKLAFSTGLNSGYSLHCIHLHHLSIKGHQVGNKTESIKVVKKCFRFVWICYTFNSLRSFRSKSQNLITFDFNL